MEKKVYCLLESRCKCVKFTSEKDTSDVQVIRRKLKEASKEDMVLEMMLRNKLMVLQRADPDRDNKPCDIEEDDEIPNKCEIIVLLIAQPTNASSECDIANSYVPICDTMLPVVNCVLPTKTTIDDSDNVHNAIEVPVCYEDNRININEDIEIIDALPTGKDMPNNSKRLKIEEDIEIIDALPTDKDMPNNSKRLKIEEGNNSAGTSGIARSMCIRFPTILPSLPLDLQQKVDNVGLLNAQKQLIGFWAAYLLHATNQRPTKSDYCNFAQSIVLSYPALADTDGGCTIVRSQLSVWIRNHRALNKRQVKMQMQREVDMKSTSSQICIVEEIKRSTDHITHKDIQNALKELEKKVMYNKNIKHMKYLLQITMEHRRKWIDKADRIIDIINKYPQLKIYELIVSEFVELKKISEKELFDASADMIEKLKKYYSTKNIDNNNTAMILHHLYADLSKRNKKSAKLFTVMEVMTNINLNTHEGDAPRIVMYTDGQDVIQAFLLADKEIKIQIPQPSLEMTVAGLLACYYVWNRKFPAVYANVLSYMEYEIFKSPVPANSTIKKFIRSQNDILQGLNNVHKSLDNS